MEHLEIVRRAMQSVGRQVYANTEGEHDGADVYFMRRSLALLLMRGRNPERTERDLERLMGQGYHYIGGIQILRRRCVVRIYRLELTSGGSVELHDIGEVTVYGD